MRERAFWDRVGSDVILLALDLRFGAAWGRGGCVVLASDGTGGTIWRIDERERAFWDTDGSDAVLPLSLRYEAVLGRGWCDAIVLAWDGREGAIWDKGGSTAVRLTRVGREGAFSDTGWIDAVPLAWSGRD